MESELGSESVVQYPHCFVDFQEMDSTDFTIQGVYAQMGNLQDGAPPD